MLKVPRATYRLQFNRDFPFRRAVELVPYLHELGISHVYASPLLKAQSGSTHGYDVCDFTQLNPEHGTEAELAALVAALRTRGMGLVLDIVPNHMGVAGPDNRWWWDVLAHGRASRYAACFDIDWDSPEPGLHGKVLLPVLGDHLEQVLANGELSLAVSEDAAVLQYYNHRFPLAPESLPFSGKPLVETIREINHRPEALAALIEQQHYRLAFWRDGDARLNYRRFFNISTLAGLRIEDPRVFRDAHALVLRWQNAGWLDGLRVDHPDGLRDPQEYLDRLRAAAPDAWIVVEKILEPDEALPDTWSVAGTTGYDFLNRVNGLFVDPAGEEPLTRFYTEFTGEPTDFSALVREKKRLVLRESLAAEVRRLVRLLAPLAARDERCRNVSRETLTEALRECVACFPVYRTYVRPAAGQVSGADVAHIRQAVTTASSERLDLAGVYACLGDLLKLRFHGEAEAEFVMRFQQLTGPAMAKGVEDTAFYCFNRFVSLNEVGGDPGQFGLAPEAFHRACAETQARWPATMLATSTHDTKRSEDMRARLSLLSEIPTQWAATVRRWSAMNERHRRDGFADRNAEYLLYQTLVGAWPLELARVLAYMEKAACEAKTHTSWTHRNESYHAALKAFITGALADPEFTADLAQFVAPLVEPGHVVSLAQTLLKLTAPGVPDLYQGTELWDWSLVDPDNRRPVDFDLRCRLLGGLADLSVEEIWRRRAEGLPKLWLIQKTLGLRQRRPEIFDARSGYAPLTASGAKSHHVVAFHRTGGAVVIVPRLVLGLAGDWADTTLEMPEGRWLNEFTGESVDGGPVRLADQLRQFPVALLSLVVHVAQMTNETTTDSEKEHH